MLKNFVSNWLQSRGYVKAEYSKQVGRWLLPEAEATQWEMPDPSRHIVQSNLYATLNYIGTVVDIIAETCIDSDFDVMDKTTEKEIDNHPLELLIEKPNEFDSRTDFLRAHFSNRKLYGNSYWYLSRLNKDTPPDELYILSPEKITPAVDGKMGLKGYIYYPGNGQEIPLETWEVLHTKSYNPYNRYVGLSPLLSLAVVAFGAKAALEWNTRLFANNNARLPGILAFSEMIQDADWEKMKREVGDATAKRNNMMLRGVGKGGVEWMQGGATQREMEFLAGLKSNEESIYNRLAPGLYSAMQPSALTNGENGMYLYMKSTIQPLLRELTDKINAGLLPVYGKNQKAEYEDVVPEDKEMKMAEIDQFAKFHTIDEVRVEKFGNDPDPDKERGALLITQVTAKQAEPVQSVAQETPEAEQVEPVQEPQDKEDAEMKADLSRWKRKATKNLGNAPKMTGFESDYIPADMARTIRESLPACKTADDVAGVFEVVKHLSGTEYDHDQTTHATGGGGKPNWAGDKSIEVGGYALHNGRFGLVKDKWAVEMADGKNGNFRDTPAEAIADFEKLRDGAAQRIEASQARTRTIQNLVSENRPPTMAEIRTISNGYPNFSTTSAIGVLKEAGYTQKEAERLLDYGSVGSLGVSAGGANLWDGRDVVNLMVEKLQPIKSDITAIKSLAASIDALVNKATTYTETITEL